MREIKFRAKGYLNGLWMFGDLNTSVDAIICDDGIPEYIDNTTVGQFTGMYDKHGKEIYEGDIVLQRGYNNKMIAMEVKFEHGAFIVGYHNGSSTKTTPMLLNDRCEVIGNIYDNPELMKGEWNGNNRD